jgi:hypothetical protein
MHYFAYFGFDSDCAHETQRQRKRSVETDDRPGAVNGG